MSNPGTTSQHSTDRRPWEPPTLRRVGTVGSVLKGGTNKVTVVSGDPGEPQKIPGNDL